MNPDLQKLRDSRLFAHLPDRAFERLLKYIKVRAYESAQSITVFGKTPSEFKNYFGYVISGRVIMLNEVREPLGLAVRDEFFLGRAFSLSDQKVTELISGHDQTLLVWLPKEVFEVLSSNSAVFAELIEEIYDSIFDRSQVILKDKAGTKKFTEWLGSHDAQKTLSSWLGGLEKKKLQAENKKLRERQDRRFAQQLWFWGFLMCFWVTWEAGARLVGINLAPTYFFGYHVEAYHPGSDFNVALGIIGYSFLIFTNIHTVTKFGIRKFKWKWNYKRSSQLHIFFGIVGAVFTFFHTAFHLQGYNVAHYALYALGVAVVSGIIGQLISNQIPKTISGEKMKLAGLQKEQSKLHQKASLLLEEGQMKTSVQMIAPKQRESNIWLMILQAPFVWFRSQKLKSSLKGLGLGKESASLAAELIRSEYNIQQKIKFLQASNLIFKRWMLIHKPIGYLLYGLGAIHIVLVTLFA